MRSQQAAHDASLVHADGGGFSLTGVEQWLSESKYIQKLILDPFEAKIGGC